MTAKAKKRSVTAPPSGQPTLVKASFVEKYGVWFYLFLAFFIPFILMFFAFKVAGVSPFGTNQILVTDLWHQYYPFMVDFQDKLQHGGSLLWTWKSGGGTNYASLMSYYLASPLNFFSVLVPADKLREFLYIITCVKIGLAGFFYALFLKLTFKRKDVVITAFGILYALCAFIMGYYWNIIWLDTIALLPLVIAGTIALLRDGKFKLYIITLALSILANYYIGLFTCIFVFLVSLGYCIVEYKGWKDLIRQFLKMLGCSIVGIMMSAILTLPAYFALGYTHSSDNSFPTQFAVNIASKADLGGVLEAMGKTIANSVAFTEPTSKEGLPNVYCGVIVIFLAILFFFCSKIKKRERIFCGGLLLFFMLSFIIRQLDYIWHGFHFPNMLPHRFSFLYCFVLIYMAFRVFMHIDELKPAPVIGAILVFAVYLGIASVYFDGETVKLSPIFEQGSKADPVLLSGFFGIILAAWVLLFTLRNTIPRNAQIIGAGVIGIAAAILVFVNGKYVNAAVGQTADKGFYIFMGIVILLLTAAAVLLLYTKDLNRDNRMPKVILSVLVLILALIEGMFSAATGVKTVGVTDATSYPLGTTDTLACVDHVKTLEQNNIDLERTEVNKYHTLNDNALIGVDGISMFNSLVNKDITAYMEKLGICGWVASNRYTYQEGSPFTNLMLNIKYLIAPYGAYLDTVHNNMIYESGNAKLMQNKYYLPQGFMVNKELLAYDVNSANPNPFMNQITMFRMATGLEGNLYNTLNPGSAKGENANDILTDSGNGNYSYSSANNASSYNVDYTAPEDGTAMAYFSCGDTDSVSVRVNGVEKNSYYTKRPFIMMAGDVKKGDIITLHVSINDHSHGSFIAHCAMLNEDLFNQGYNKLAQSTLKATKVTDTVIEGDITAQQSGVFYTSISYAKGWKAYVDGKEAEITPIGKAMLAFKLEAGTHHIRLTYLPEGFAAGATCTVLAVLILIAMIILVPRREKIMAKIRKKPAEEIGSPEDQEETKE